MILRYAVTSPVSSISIPVVIFKVVYFSKEYLIAYQTQPLTDGISGLLLLIYCCQSQRRRFSYLD